MSPRCLGARPGLVCYDLNTAAPSGYCKEMRTILATIDFSEVTSKIVALTESMARAFGGCRVCLLHVAPPDPDFVGYDPGPQAVRDQLAEKFREEHRQIHEIQEDLKEQGIDTTALLIQGPTVEKILEEIDRQEVDLVVMGSHGHGLLRKILIGSVTEAVLREALCNVLIVPAPLE